MDHRQALARAGLKATKQRLAILEALDGRTEAVTAQDLHHELRRRGGSAGLATIYRTLSSLAAVNVLDTFRRHEGGEQAFRLCGVKHHHHLVCQRCGKVDEVVSSAIEAWVQRAARQRGFRVVSHSADVYGVCASCG
jgi:Fur family ferric uptake transcriptional regulator